MFFFCNNGYYQELVLTYYLLRSFFSFLFFLSFSCFEGFVLYVLPIIDVCMLYPPTPPDERDLISRCGAGGGVSF